VLGQAKSEEVRAALIGALGDSQVDIRICAARAGKVGDAAAIPALKKALLDGAQTATHGPPVTPEAVAAEAIRKLQQVER